MTHAAHHPSNQGTDRAPMRRSMSISSSISITTYQEPQQDQQPHHPSHPVSGGLWPSSMRVLTIAPMCVTAEFWSGRSRRTVWLTTTRAFDCGIEGRQHAGEAHTPDLLTMAPFMVRRPSPRTTLTAPVSLPVTVPPWTASILNTGTGILQHAGNCSMEPRTGRWTSEAIITTIEGLTR